ncbi:MAG: lipopolysaccharide biosynthesis protein [Bacteroidaceae bacterium]|nr:lipopolysaccharide biosynthesis protein [Bacteroidaceae bacterium]
MSDQSTNNKRIAKNSLLLYVRMLFIMGVTLFTSRVILQALGVEDYGIYNVVGGFVSMFALISNSMTAAIGRFITFELGKGEKSNIGAVFSTSVIIQMTIAMIVVLLSEAIGVWFLNTQMTIPADRIYAANWVFQLSIITFAINLISVPYNATIIAHEHMGAFAYISSLDAVLKLLVAYLIFKSPIDKLIYYATLMCMLSILIRFIYTLYCRKHFQDCKLQWKLDRPLIKEIFGFAGWNFIGAGSGILRDQGVNVLLNIFCGPIVNAARGIAMQVNSAVQHFATSFTTALNPQITKSYAGGDKEYSFKLVFQGSKLAYLLLYIVSLPIIIEAPTILSLWLGEVPEYTIAFVRLVIIYGLTEGISYPLITLMLATGNIRNYQILVGGAQMLNFPLSYLLLKFGASPEYTFVVSIAVAFVCLFLRLIMLKRMIELPVIRFMRSVVLKVIIVSLTSFPLPLLSALYLETSITRVLVTTSVSIVSVMFFALFFGCSPKERTFIVEKTTHIVRSIFSKP